MTYSESRRRYAEVLGSVVDDHQEVMVTRPGRESVVIVSLEDYESLKETVKMTTGTAEVARLMASIRELEAGPPEADGKAI